MTQSPWLAIAMTSAFALFSQNAFADALLDWNGIAVDAAAASSAEPGEALKALALVHEAMFEALNSIERRYEPKYSVTWRAQPRRSLETVAAAAAHYVLVELYPAHSDRFHQALKKTLSAVADQQAAYAGAAIGIGVAQLICEGRPREHTEPASPRRIATGDDGQHGTAPIDIRRWNAEMLDLAASMNLDPVDTARILALASAAAARALSSGVGDGRTARTRVRAAVASALKPELVLLELRHAGSGASPTRH